MDGDEINIARSLVFIRLKRKFIFGIFHELDVEKYRIFFFPFCFSPHSLISAVTPSPRV